MPSYSEIQLQKCFDRIKNNYKTYIEAHMVSKMEDIQKNNPIQIKQIQDYVQKITEFRNTQEDFLDHALLEASFASKVGGGALAALAGVGVGGAAYLLNQYVTPATADLDPKWINAHQGLGSFFSISLGLGASYLAYQAFSQQNPDLVNDKAALQKAFKAAGFDKQENYQELISELIKLFHYRECLLLNLKSDGTEGVRTQFQKKQFKPDTDIDNQCLNMSIEAYFIDELNHLFNKSFENIYRIQDQHIENDEKAAKILTWLKSFLSDPAQRRVFTEQLQIEFMNLCVKYLIEKQNEPSFIKKHRLVISALNASVAGLLTTSLAFIVLATVSVGTFGVGIVIPLAILVAGVVGASVYLLIGNINRFTYKRDQENREKISEAITHIKDEKIRLEKLVKQVTNTTKEDLEQISKHRKASQPQGYFSTFLNYFGVQTKRHPLIGSPNAWLTEYASRYRHSKMMENDLGDEIKGIIMQADHQTRTIRQALETAINYSTHSTELPKDLQKMIQDTRDFLSNEDQREFIQSFNLHAKLRQHCLEIVDSIGRVTKKGDMRPLPPAFIEFYTNDLHGDTQDLELTRRIAPIYDNELLSDGNNHPLHSLLIHARMLDEDLPSTVLKGDNNFREKLGLPRIESENIISSISTYLSSSFDFLFSLNRATSIDHPLLHTEEFAIYKTVLFKQLATLVDPNNLSIDPEVKKQIYSFMENKFELTHEQIQDLFNAIINQSFTFDPDSSKKKLTNLLNNKVSVAGLNHVTDAIRLVTTFTTDPLTARTIIYSVARADKFTEEQIKAIFFDYEESSTLNPSKTEGFPNTTIAQAIDASKRLLQLLETAKPKDIFKNYLELIQQNITLLMESIIRADKIVPPVCDSNGNPIPLNLDANIIEDVHLKQAFQKLENYLAELNDKLTPLTQSSIIFNKSSVSSLFLSQWVLPNIEENFNYTLIVLQDYLESLKHRLEKYRPEKIGKAHKLSTDFLFFNQKAVNQEAQSLEEFIKRVREFPQLPIEEQKKVSYDMYVAVNKIMSSYEKSTPLFNALSELRLLFDNLPPEPIIHQSSEPIMLRSNYFAHAPQLDQLPADNAPELIEEEGWCTIADIISVNDVSKPLASSSLGNSSAVILSPKTLFITLLESCLNTIEQPLPLKGAWLCGLFGGKETKYDESILNQGKVLLEKLKADDRDLNETDFPLLEKDTGQLGECVRKGFVMLRSDANNVPAPST